MRTVLFTGSRCWQDVDTVIDACSTLAKPYRGIVGDADGFDSIVWEVLAELAIPRHRFKAYWNVYGKPAGFVRNREMISWLARARARGHSAFVVAGWDGKSPGTRGCINDAQAQGFDVMRLSFHPRLNGR